MLKRITSSETMRGILTWLAAQYIQLVQKTGAWRIIGEDIPDGLIGQNKPFIVAFWHGRLIMMAFSWKRCDLVHMLISGHRDGQLVSGMMSHFGSKTVFGSSTRGGAAAFIQLARLLRSGEVVGITPDGPGGPRMQVNSGVISLAKIADVPILPLTYSVKRGHVFRSWDRFVLPFPCSKGVFLWGDPIYVDKESEETELEVKREELENALIALTHRADWLMGRADVEPVPASNAETG